MPTFYQYLVKQSLKKFNSYSEVDFIQEYQPPRSSIFRKCANILTPGATTTHVGPIPKISINFDLQDNIKMENDNSDLHTHSSLESDYLVKNCTTYKIQIF